jgi:hypothetical protein
MKNTFAVSTFAFALALVASAASAATIEYRLLVNDVLGKPVVFHGTNTLKVEGRVLDNVVTGSTMGGFIQSSFDLSDTAGAITWKQRVGFLGAPSGTWDSTTNAKFGNHNAGVIVGGKVIQETGSIPLHKWNADFAAVGANAWSTIATGQFTWSGVPTTLNLTSTVAVNSIATLKEGAIGGKAPDGVTGFAILPFPEPATFAMAGMALVCMVAASRRRQDSLIV